MTSETGLSPLARGTYRDDRMTEFVTRFIPAGAGNIPVPDGGSVLDPVYPRWRGEHTKHMLLFYNDFLRQ